MELIEEAEAHGATKRLARRIAEREDSVAEVLYDGKSGAGALENELRALEVDESMYRKASPSEVADAASVFSTSVDNGDVTHWADPGQRRFDRAVTGATRRGIGRDGFGFDGPASHVVEAAALALLSARTATRDPSAEMRVG